ncbi:MAG: D-alanyl-D-alanine carboxypeptidase, partial [Chitinophagaceae bacterium]
MRKVYWFIGLLVCWFGAQAQTVEQKLAGAVKVFEADSQMRHAIMGLAVMDAKTGEILYERNSQIGLAPASTQKIFTSIAGFELLGKDYRYKTRLAYSGKITKGDLDGHLYIVGSGDPSLGSWRFSSTKDSLVLLQWIKAVKKAGISRIDGIVTTNEASFSHQAIPDGWIWQDIGNYYGAGAYQLNWKENQYEVILRSGDKINDSVVVVNENEASPLNNYVNELKTAAKGTGDNAYIYFPLASDRNVLLTGTIPAGEKKFTISGAYPDPVSELVADFSWALYGDSVHNSPPCFYRRDLHNRKKSELDALKFFYTYSSPAYDSLNYWFMRRSINLYGEAFIKTIAYEKEGFGETDAGVQLV